MYWRHALCAVCDGGRDLYAGGAGGHATLSLKCWRPHCGLLCMSKAMEGVLYLLEVPEVTRLMPLCMLEAVEVVLHVL